jgi:hypothetical protein
MTCYKSSIEALQQLLHLGTTDGKISDKSNSNVVHCQITKTSKDVSWMRNGLSEKSVRRPKLLVYFAYEAKLKQVPNDRIAIMYKVQI